MNDLLTVPEAAKLLQRHPLTVWRAVKSGALPAKRYGWQFLITPADLADYVQNRRPARRPRRKPELFETKAPGCTGFDIDVVLAKAEPMQITLQN